MSQLYLGELAAAEQNLRRSLDLCREIEDERTEAPAHLELGRLLAYRGIFDEAESELKLAQTVFDKYGASVTNFVSVVRAYRAHRALLIGNIHSALKAAQQACALANEFAKGNFPVESDFVRAEWLLGEALVTQGKDLNAAATHLSDALTRCRRINLVYFEPGILLAWARLYYARDNAPEAQSYAEEALAIADRCEFRLMQAEINNFLARLMLEAGNRKAAQQHAETARERAWCDGPPHCYKPALDEAEGMLKELGVKEEK